jgi:hypothetical protein
MQNGIRILVVILILFLMPACGGKSGSHDTGASSQEISETPDNPANPDLAVAVDGVDNGLLPLFDTHAHQTPMTFPDGWLESLLADHDPLGIVLLGIGDVKEHQQNYPTKVFAFGNFKDLNIDFDQLEGQLNAGFWGIGEVSIRHFASGPPGSLAVENDFNEPDLLKLYGVARDHQVPILFHFDYHEDHVGEIAATLPDFPEVTFIWAHSGDAQPEQLRPLLEALDNLHLDISCRNPLESFEGRLTSTELQRLDEADGTLKTAWKELLTDYADRFYFGSDIGPNGRLEQYGEIQDYYRGILAQLDPEVAEKIAYKNAQKLYGLSDP